MVFIYYHNGMVFMFLTLYGIYIMALYGGNTSFYSVLVTY